MALEKYRLKCGALFNGGALCGPGSVVELSEEEAAVHADWLEPAGGAAPEGGQPADAQAEARATEDKREIRRKKR